MDNIKTYTITVSDGSRTSSFEFTSEKNFDMVLDEVYSEIIF